MTGPLERGPFASAVAPPVRVLLLRRGSAPAPTLATAGLGVGVEDVVVDTPEPGLPLAREVRVRAASLAAARGVPGRAATVYAVKRSAALRQASEHADVVVSTDAELDAALTAVPDVLRGLAWVPSTHLPHLGALLVALGGWAERLEEATHNGTDPLGVPDAVLTAPITETVPGFPVEVVLADLTRRLTARSRTLGGRAARLTLAALGPAPEDAVRSGLAAHAAAGGLVTSPDPEHTDLGALREVVRSTLDAADVELAAGRAHRALLLLTDALRLLFHRELHADAAHSPLVDDPAGWLADLLGSHTYRAVVTGGAGPAPHAPPAGGDGAAVAVVTGAYGSFHPEVVHALRETGGVDVDVLELPRRQFFGRNGLTADALYALVAVRRWPAGPAVPVPALLRSTDRTLLRDLTALGGRPAVFSDWADKSTAFLSHALAPGARLTTRIHRVDAFDPWVVLTDWSRVSEVVVVSPAFRDLVRAVLAALGHDVPVRVVPSFGSIVGLARPKPDEARTRLGLIGWGRRPKDPLWAFDLLERCPGYTLVCVGAPPPTAVPTVAGRAYHEEVARRLERLADRVEVVGWTDDVPGVLQTIGVILSTSRSEGCHRGLIEGAGSGAVPVVRDWPLLASRGGPRGLVPDAWVVTTVEEAAERLLDVTRPESWRAEVADTAERASELFDGSSADAAYVAVVLGEDA